MANIEITVRRPVRKGKRRRGPVDSSSKKNILARRKLTSGIRFFDMGYIRNESNLFETLQFAVTPAFDQDTRLPEVVDESFFNAIETEIFAIPVNQWTSRFKQIMSGNDSSRYGMILYDFSSGAPIDSDPRWQGGSLNVDPGEIAELYSVDLDVTGPFFFNPPEGLVVTTEPDPNATPVTFTSSPKMDVFFAPGFCLSFGTAVSAIAEEFDAGPPPSSWISGAFSYLNYFYLVWPREYFLDPTNAFFGLAAEGGYSVAPPSLPVYQNAWNALQVHKSLYPGTRGRLEQVGTLGTSDSSVWSDTGSFPVGDYPTPPSLPWSAPPFPDGANLNVLRSKRPARFRYAVQKDGQTYYVWSVIE